MAKLPDIPLDKVVKAGRRLLMNLKKAVRKRK